MAEEDNATLLDETKSIEVVEKDYSLDPNDYPKGSWHRRQLEMWILFEEPHTSKKAFGVELIMVFLTFVCLITMMVDWGVHNNNNDPMGISKKDLLQMQLAQNPEMISQMSEAELAATDGEEDKGAWWMGGDPKAKVDPPVVKEIVLFILESFCMIGFTIEYVCRLLASPVTIGVPSFLCNFMNTLDIITILPYYLELSLMTYTGAWPWQLGAPHHPEKYFAMLRIFRLSRILRFGKVYNLGFERTKPKHYKYY